MYGLFFWGNIYIHWTLGYNIWFIVGGRCVLNWKFGKQNLSNDWIALRFQLNQVLELCSSYWLFPFLSYCSRGKGGIKEVATHEGRGWGKFILLQNDSFCPKEVTVQDSERQDCCSSITTFLFLSVSYMQSIKRDKDGTFLNWSVP